MYFQLTADGKLRAPPAFICKLPTVCYAVFFLSTPCLRGDNALFFDIKESWKGKTNPSPELYLLNHLTFLEAPIRPMGRFVVKLSIKMFCEEINLIDVNKQQLSLFLDSRKRKRKRKLTINLLAHVNDLSLLMLSRRYTRSAMNG